MRIGPLQRFALCLLLPVLLCLSTEHAWAQFNVPITVAAEVEPYTLIPFDVPTTAKFIRIKVTRETVVDGAVKRETAKFEEAAHGPTNADGAPQPGVRRYLFTASPGVWRIEVLTLDNDTGIGEGDAQVKIKGENTPPLPPPPQPGDKPPADRFGNVAQRAVEWFAKAPPAERKKVSAGLAEIGALLESPKQGKYVTVDQAATAIGQLYTGLAPETIAAGHKVAADWSQQFAEFSTKYDACEYLECLAVGVGWGV